MFIITHKTTINVKQKLSYENLPPLFMLFSNSHNCLQKLLIHDKQQGLTIFKFCSAASHRVKFSWGFSSIYICLLFRGFDRQSGWGKLCVIVALHGWRGHHRRVPVIRCFVLSITRLQEPVTVSYCWGQTCQVTCNHILHKNKHILLTILLVSFFHYEQLANELLRRTYSTKHFDHTVHLCDKNGW